MNIVELLDELSVAVRRDAALRRRRKRLAIVAATLCVFVIGGVGIAGTYDDWWTNNAPAVQPDQLNEIAQENDSVGIHLDLSKKATVARIDDAALDAVATNGGAGYCMSLFFGTKMMDAPCTTQSDSEYRTQADDSHWVAYGRILDDGAAALDLSGAGLPAHVPLERGGFFLFDIPRDEWASLDGRTGDIAILDTHGNTIRRACVFVGFAPGKPMAGEGGLGDKPGTCAALKPLIPDPEVDKAKRLVTLTLTHDQGVYKAGDTIALWSEPNRGGGMCFFMSGAADAPRTGAGSCSLVTTPSYTPSLGSTLVGGDHYANLVQGFVDPALGVAKVELVGASETLPASYANGAYLAELPDSPRAGKEPGPIPGGPWRVALYDAAGTELKSEVLPAR